MLVEFTEILHDLELKRAAALDAGQRPAIDVGAAVAGLPVPGPDLSVRSDDGAEEPYAPALAGAMAADALSALAVAHGDDEADGTAARATGRAAAVRGGERLA